MKALFTYTGVPAGEIPARLAVPFSDPKAYKGIPGGADLTHISFDRAVYTIIRLILGL